MKLTPLKQWICDTCGEIIKQPKDGWFEWYSDRKAHLHTGFRIVHHKHPCQYDCEKLRQQNKTDLSECLTDVVGSDGLGSLLNMMALPENISPYKLADIGEFAEIIRRLHLPYWEEARLYWKEARKDGFHDGCSVSEDTLLSIITEYGESCEG